MEIRARAGARAGLAAKARAFVGSASVLAEELSLGLVIGFPQSQQVYILPRFCCEKQGESGWGSHTHF